VVVVLWDDIGFASLGCFGSEIETPNIDAIAAQGLVYNNFHTTALCSPTRASLLTGRNHHSVGMSIIANADSGFPSKRGAVSNSAGTLAEMLREAGYGTIAIGKWHLAPTDQTGPSGPFSQWPLGRGFDHFYGFLEALTDQFEPELVHDNHRIDPPRTADEGYTLNEDLIDHAIQYVTDHVSAAPDRPFLLYLATGATHSPHQAPTEYLEKYRGRYDEGWDVVRERRLARQVELGIVPPGTGLAPHNPGVRAWDELGNDEQRLYARFQEAYAAFLDHTDHELGRLIAHLKSIGEFDNTAFLLMSDNGASQEGQLHGSVSTTFYENGHAETLEYNLERIDQIGTRHARNNYPLGWAQAANTPLKRYKQNTHAGGVRDPLIIAWPQGITEAGTRSQFHHVIDIVPTVLEIAGVQAPAVIRGIPQMPIHGTSLRYTFDSNGPSRKSVQHFEMFGHRAIWRDGWKAVAYHVPGSNYDDDVWELYHVDVDVSEVHNRADDRPELLGALIDAWWEEARRYDVLPLDDRGFAKRRAQSRLRPGAPRGRRSYRYLAGTGHHPMGTVPFIFDRSYELQADVVIDESSEGVIVACGGVSGGYTLYVMGGEIRHDYNYYQTVYRVSAPLPASGPHTIGYRFDKTGPLRGMGTLTIDGEDVDAIELPATYPYFMDWEGLDIGSVGLSPVSPEYPRREFPFSGELREVRFELGEDTDGPGDYEPQD
jgi:arylsulfatase